MAGTEELVTDRDGVDVFIRHWPVDDPRAAVVIAHGASEHSGRYARLAGVLNDHGYEAWAIDHRGHGRTAASSGMGRFGPRGFDGLLDDLADLIDRAASSGRPVVLFGHSMGSVITQAFVERRDQPLAGYVLCGSLGVSEDSAAMVEGLQGAVDAGMGDEPMDVLGPFNEAFEPARTPFDWLSRDEAEVDAYIADPMCGGDNPLTYGYILEVVRAAADAVTPEGIGRVPDGLVVLIIAGERDPAGGMGENVRVLEGRLRDRGLPVTSHYYPDARHEILNETNRDEVHADIVAWLDDITAPA